MHYVTKAAQMNIDTTNPYPKVMALCGKTVDVLELGFTYLVNAVYFINRNDKCPECENHPDMPLFVLGKI